jgi:sortase A
MFAAGIVLLTVSSLALLDRTVSSRAALEAFDEQVDFSLWSEQRVREFKESARPGSPTPAAVLEIRRLGLRVPVFEGTDELTLNRGAGWIAGTARPGENGNVGIAGHRDGFFRGLKDVRVGDAVSLATREGYVTYRVDGIRIVEPERVEVLEAGEASSLTLVTCYPFYFVGSAPQRFIVHATREDAVSSSAPEPGRP